MFSEGAPSTKHLFEELHQKLGLTRTPADKESQCIKAAFFAVGEHVFRRFGDEHLNDDFLQSLFGDTALDTKLLLARSQKEVVNHLEFSSSELLNPLLEEFYYKYKNILIEGLPDPSGTAILLAEMESELLLLRRPHRGTREFDTPFLVAAESGLSTQRLVEGGVLNVIPRVAKEKYNVTLLPSEEDQINTGATNFIKALSLTHIDIFRTILTHLMPDQISFRQVLQGQILPYDTDPFVIARRAGHLHIDFSREFMRKLLVQIQDTRKQLKLLITPFVGCPGSSIAPAVHRAVLAHTGPALRRNARHIRSLPRLAA